jgi:MFS family permease
VRRSSALSVPNYRVYFFGTAVSQSSSWLLRTSQSWLVLDLTGSPAALGVLALAQFLPVTILTLFAGVLIDRIATRRMLFATQAVTAAQAAVMAVLVLSGRIEYWQILVLAAILGIANAFDTPTRAALASQLVGPGMVGNAIALNSALGNGARIIGPGLGGVMIALWGTGVCFAVAAVGSVVGLAGLVLLRADRLFPKRQAGRGAVLGQLWAGITYTMSVPTLAFNIVLMAFMGTFAYNWGVTLPILARYGLDAGPEAFGALNAAMGIGSVFGGLLLAMRLKPSMRMVVISAGAYALLILALAVTPGLEGALVLLLAIGGLSIVYSASSNTLLQIEAREEFRGRALALFVLLWAGTTPIGSAFTGLLSDRWGIRVALTVDAVICIVGLGVALAYAYIARARRLAAARSVVES